MIITAVTLPQLIKMTSPGLRYHMSSLPLLRHHNLFHLQSTAACMKELILAQTGFANSEIMEYWTPTKQQLNKQEFDKEKHLHPGFKVLQAVPQCPQSLLAWQHHLQRPRHGCPLPSHKGIPVLQSIL